jgi:hypothetical protein
VVEVWSIPHLQDSWDREACAGQLEKTVGMVQAGQER